jgi:hypothetical protein
MPNGISNSDLIDLTRTTLENLPNMEFEVALEYQDYPVINHWFKGEKKQIESGTSIQRNIILDTSGNAKHVRLYQKTPINVGDIQTQLTAPWVQAQTHWSIERREALRNRAPARFIDLLKSRRLDATLDLAELLQVRAWSAPTSATDDLNPRGVPYWISKLVPGGAGVNVDQSFSGHRINYTGGTTSSSKGGIDGSTSANAKWRNYCATYTAINSDFVKRLRRAFHATSFKSPITVKDLDKGPASKYRLYMALDELTEYEDLVTKANDNLGRDLDPFHGSTTFKRVPIIYEPQLDSDSHGAVYGINHDKFYPVVQEGDWMREGDPMMDVEQHNVITTFIDCSYQYLCTNVREGGFVLHTAQAS